MSSELTNFENKIVKEQENQYTLREFIKHYKKIYNCFDTVGDLNKWTDSLTKMVKYEMFRYSLAVMKIDFPTLVYGYFYSSDGVIDEWSKDNYRLRSMFMTQFKLFFNDNTRPLNYYTNMKFTVLFSCKDDPDTTRSFNFWLQNKELTWKDFEIKVTCSNEITIKSDKEICIRKIELN